MEGRHEIKEISTFPAKANLLIVVVITIIGATLVIGAAALCSYCQTTPPQAFAQEQSQQQDTLVKQNTTTSMQDPVPGHEAHQLAVVAPPRDDGKIWSGVVTFTASKPVDVVVLHPYDRPQLATTNQTFGEPLNAPNPFAPGEELAITLMTKETDNPVFSGSLPFTGTALAFHTTTGEPFTVTYTVDAEAKSLIQ